jgi:hypothetical protein
MHYLCTVGYETEKMDQEGNPRLQKLKFIVEAESVEEATIVMSKFRGGDTRASQSLSVAKMVIDSIISPESRPECYK